MADISKFKLINKVGGIYSNISFNIQQNLSPDGLFLKCPSNCIFEVKSINDIRGNIR